MYIWIFSSSTTTVCLVSFRSLIVIFSSTCSKEAGLVRKGDKKKKQIFLFFFFFQKFSNFSVDFSLVFSLSSCLILFMRRIFIALPYRGNIIIDTCIIVTRTHIHTYTYTHVERISPSCRRLILTLFAKLLYPIRNEYKCINV